MQITRLWYVTKILSCQVSITSRQGIRQLGTSFGYIFLLFSYSCMKLAEENPGPCLLITALGSYRQLGL